MHRTGLGAGIDKDQPDYTIYCGGGENGRIYQTRGWPEKSALVLVADGRPSHGALQSSGELGRSQRGQRLHAGKVIPSANAAGRDEVYRGLRT